MPDTKKGPGSIFSGKPESGAFVDNIFVLFHDHHLLMKQRQDSTDCRYGMGELHDASDVDGDDSGAKIRIYSASGGNNKHGPSQSA